MKLSSILKTALPVTAFFGGLFYFFSTQLVGLFLALCVLLTALVVLVRRRLTRLDGLEEELALAGLSGGRYGVGGGPIRVSDALKSQQPVERQASGGQAAQPDVDRDVFSRFRAHLENLEQSGPTPITGPATPARQAALPAGETQGAEGEVTVKLSSTAKDLSRKAPPKTAAANPYQPGGAKPAVKAKPEPAKPESAKTGSAKAEPGSDLFSDLRSPFLEGKDETLAAVPPEDPLKRKIKPVPEAQERAGAQGQELFSTRQPPAAQSPLKALDEEAGQLLAVALDLMGKGNALKAKTTLEQYMKLLAPHPELIHPTARRAEIRLAFMEGRTAEGAESFYQAIKDQTQPELTALEGLMEGLLEGLEGQRRARSLVAMQQKALAIFRQEENRPAMDVLYTRMEEAQEAAGDENKLIQFMKNHLEVKRALGDVKGQIEMIDRLGNRLYKAGDTRSAKEFYELGLKLRQETGL